MDNYGDLLHDNYVTDDALQAEEYVALVQLIDSQLQGALEGLGAGLVEGGAVTANGLTAEITAVKALIETATSGLVFVKGTGGASLAIPTGTASVYLWLQALLPDTTDYDSRRTGAVRFLWTPTSAAPPNAVALAHGSTTTGALVLDQDLREWCPARGAAQVTARLEALEAAVGVPYDSESTLADRVTALEETGGSETGGYRIWKNMPRDVGDNTTPEQAMDAKDSALIADHIARYHAADGVEGGPPELTQRLDLDPANRLRMTLRLTRTVDPDLLDSQVNVFGVVWGVSGDGTPRTPGGAATPNNVDWDNSTWTG